MKPTVTATAIACIVVVAAVFLGIRYYRDAQLAGSRVTLLARAKYHDYEKATFSFEHGLRDDAEVPKVRNDWDLLFGNGGDEFLVTMVTDDRSRILDLGAHTWRTVARHSIPELPTYAIPTREPEVAAIEGHVYLVHTSDGDSDLYALFRVEKLVSGDSCDITWKLLER